MQYLPTGAARDEYLSISKWRQTERVQMITAMDEMIVEARRMAKSKRVRTSERIRWTHLAGQLIWYKDSILRNKTYEALEVELWILKEEVFRKRPAEATAPGYTISPPQPIPPTANKTAGQVSDSNPYLPRQGRNQP